MDTTEAAPTTTPNWYTCSLCGQDVLGQDDYLPCYDGINHHDSDPALRPDPDDSPCWCNAYSRDEDGILPETNLEHPMGTKGCAYADEELND